MCTAVISFAPGAPVPVLVAGVRDELTDRPWQAPGHHWPEYPDLIGGRDEQAGGTWLAVNPEAQRVTCVLNGHGQAPQNPRTRGTLPLAFAATGSFDEDPASYAPFHLVGAEPAGVRLWSWDGESLVERKLEPGLHFVVNSGLAQPGSQGGDDQMSARVAYFRPRFEAVGVDGWRDLLNGDGLMPDDQRALIVRHELDEGLVWGTTSVSLVRLDTTGVGYEFTGSPGEPESWYRVL